MPEKHLIELIYKFYFKSYNGLIESLIVLYKVLNVCEEFALSQLTEN